MLRGIIGSLSRGSVVVADCYYPSYFTTAMLQFRGVDIVSVSHNSRTVNFAEGHTLGPSDHIVEWQ